MTKQDDLHFGRKTGASQPPTTEASRKHVEEKTAGLASLVTRSRNRTGIQEANIELFETNENQVRTNPKRDEESFEELCAAIKLAGGVLNPILVEQKENGSLFIRAGERRYHAGKEVGLRKLPYRIISGDTKHVDLFENLGRSELPALDLARGYESFRKYDSNGELRVTPLSISEMAKILGKDRSRLSILLDLLEMPEVVADLYDQEIVKDGKYLKILTKIAEQDKELAAVMCQKIKADSGNESGQKKMFRYKRSFLEKVQSQLLAKTLSKAIHITLSSDQLIDDPSLESKFTSLVIGLSADQVSHVEERLIEALDSKSDELLVTIKKLASELSEDQNRKYGQTVSVGNRQVKTVDPRKNKVMVSIDGKPGYELRTDMLADSDDQLVVMDSEGELQVCEKSRVAF